MATIGFIGLGNMGAPMAKNLLRAGHAVSVFDLVPAAVQALCDAGARAAPSVAAAAQAAEFVITMLPASTHVREVYLGANGLLEHAAPSTVLIECSTIDAATERELAQKANEKAVVMMDAPVSGGVAGAEAGSLTFMCGGDAATFEKIKPILAAMGRQMFLAGGHGAGQVAKICNNMLLAVQMIGTAEALRTGVDNGLDAATLSAIMRASSGDNWVLEHYNPFPGVLPAAPASRNYRPGFMVDLMCKDLGLALATAQVSATATPLALLARQLYDRHAASGNGKLDFSSIIQLLEKLPAEK